MLDARAHVGEIARRHVGRHIAADLGGFLVEIGFAKSEPEQAADFAVDHPVRFLVVVLRLEQLRPKLFFRRQVGNPTSADFQRHARQRLPIPWRYLPYEFWIADFGFSNGRNMFRPYTHYCLLPNAYCLVFNEAPRRRSPVSFARSQRCLNRITDKERCRPNLPAARSV